MQLHLFPIYQLLWLFFIYAFLGWCTEVAYAALDTGKLVNRGFLNGPLCPIYGFGALVIILCLGREANSSISLDCAKADCAIPNFWNTSMT